MAEWLSWNSGFEILPPNEGQSRGSLVSDLWTNGNGFEFDIDVMRLDEVFIDEE